MDRYLQYSLSAGGRRVDTRATDSHRLPFLVTCYDNRLLPLSILFHLPKYSNHSEWPFLVP